MIRLKRTGSACGCGGSLEVIEEGRKASPAQTVVQTVDCPAGDEIPKGGCCGGSGGGCCE